MRVQHVTEPVAWSSAVLAGDITDPGVTAREVDALLALRRGRDRVGRIDDPQDDDPHRSRAGAPLAFVGATADVIRDWVRRPGPA